MTAGTTVFDIPIAKPCFTGDEANELRNILIKGWVVQGPMVEKFEKTVCEYTGAKHAVATTSCTTALHLAMLVSNIGHGDEVICPSYSFIASANGVRHSGAEAVFVDIEKETLNLDPQKVADCIRTKYGADLVNKDTGRKLKAILTVHQIGLPSDIDRLQEIADQFGVQLIEDSACSIGSNYKGSPLGSSGNVNALSFHPRKVITCGEGGMILTDNKEMAERARVLRAHGASLSDHVRHNSSHVLYESYDEVGYNYRMTDIQAVLGISQMEKLEQFVEARINVGRRFDEAFSPIKNLAIISPAPYMTRWNYQSYPIRLVNATRVQRDNVINALKARGVSTRRGIPPIHKEPAYGVKVDLPVTDLVSDTSIFLPIFPQLTNEEVSYIIDSVRKEVG